MPNTTAEVHVPTTGGIVKAGGLGDGLPPLEGATYRRREAG